MRITILATGSRGDVQPYIALGEGLVKAGYTVRIATHQEFANVAQSRGLKYHEITVNVKELLETELAQRMLESGHNMFKFLKVFNAIGELHARPLAHQMWDACQDAEALIFTATTFGGYAFARKVNIPHAACFLMPGSPTSDFAHPLFKQYDLPIPILQRMYNLLTYAIMNQTFWMFFGRNMKISCEEVGLHDWRKYTDLRYDLILYGYSPSFIPRASGWDSRHHVTGYWFLETKANWEPPSELVDFIESGSKPVSIGFGSMKSRNPEETFTLVVDALNKAKQRGIYITGYDDIDTSRVPDNVFCVKSAPFDWLFPRMAAVVHHGGAGTTSTGLKAGVPSVIVPFFADQPFWAYQVYKRGVGTKPTLRKHLTSEILAEKISIAVNDKDMQRNAASLGEKICAEDGITNAVEILKSRFK